MSLLGDTGHSLVGVFLGLIFFFFYFLSYTREDKRSSSRVTQTQQLTSNHAYHEHQPAFIGLDYV